MELDRCCFPPIVALFCLMGFRLPFFLKGFVRERGDTSGSLKLGFLALLPWCSSNGRGDLTWGGGLELGDTAIGEPVAGG